MIGFIGTSVTYYLLITLKYSAIADLHNLHFTVAHALGGSVSTNRLLATDFNTETSTQILQGLHLRSSNYTSSIAASSHTWSLRTDCKIFSVKLFENCPRAAWVKSSQVKVKVALQLIVSQSVSLGVEPHLGLMTRYLLLFDSYGLVFFLGALSGERTGLSFVRVIACISKSFVIM
jgi:hypothetical protein